MADPRRSGISSVQFPRNMTADNGVKLVIFDKDGTLVDFHRMWLPWAANTVQLYVVMQLL
ncbi:hypothetical protein ANCDUO_12292 [Ancylostoma duodenale]|uniref:Uncharacterized protein n=1 Tax=Ancylostoma duodenale TaxID=51022 RepID=A0A0C2GKB5_9BILA|nr:hypothetical protein ANCDUO_12292 [Ancylostoma duodenale]